MTPLSSKFFRIFNRGPEDSNLRFIGDYFGFKIRRPEPYQLAMIHRSAPGSDNNERLELLGDAVLDLIVADYLYLKYPQLNEGELTKLKSKLISREQLNEIGHLTGMTEGLDLTKQKDLDPSLIIGNVVEAVFGAIYLDQGYEKSKAIAVKMFESTCDFDLLLENIHDSKSLLLEWAQREKKSLRFKVCPNDNDSFRAKVYVGEALIAQGEGRSKKRAEKAAAKNALAVIEI